MKEAQGVSQDVTGNRGARGRGGVEGRTRGRGTERGRGARGGRASSTANGTRTSEKTIKPAQEGWGDTAGGTTIEASGSWTDAPTNGDSAAVDVPASGEASKEPIAKSEETKSNAIPSGKVSGWAGLFAKPPPDPSSKKTSVSAPAPVAEESLPQLDELDHNGVIEEQPGASIDGISSDIVDAPSLDPALTLTPSKDELTHDNLEHIPDVSQPITTATAASTVASTQDPHSNLTSTLPAVRPGMSGYAASAMKATSGTGRTSSFQRRVLEQQEAVVMPDNHAVSRAAMQFGSMKINGSPDDAGLEEDREEPETRTQLPDDSPVAPRASLPEGMTLLFVSSDLAIGSLDASPLAGTSTAAESPFVGASAHEPVASVVVAPAVSPQPSWAGLTVFSEVLVPFALLAALPPRAPRPRSVPRPRVRPSSPPRPRAPRLPVTS